MFKSLWIPLLVVSAVLFGINWLADILQSLVLGLLPPAFEGLAPVAQFVQLPISSVRSAADSVSEFFIQFAAIFTSLFGLIFGNTTFGEFFTALLLSIAAFVAFVAYAVVTVVTFVFTIILFLLALLFSFVAWSF